MNIIVTMNLSDEQKKVIESYGDSVIYRPANYHTGSTATPEEMREADIIIGFISPYLLDYADNLKYIHLGIAGSNVVAAHPKVYDKAVLTNSTGCFSESIAEHMLGMTLFFYKNYNQYTFVDQAAHVYKHAGEERMIKGSNVLVIGCGSIGREYAKRMNALGARVTGIKRTPGEKPEYLENLYTLEKLDECLKDADIVALTMPQTPETVHMINEEKLSLMKDNALIVNVGRGNAIDTQALLKELESGRLQAALDVHEIEPLPAESPLWDMKNVLVLPHTTGSEQVALTRNLLNELAVENFVNYMTGKPLKNVVDYTTGYKVSNS